MTVHLVLVQHHFFSRLLSLLPTISAYCTFLGLNLQIVSHHISSFQVPQCTAKRSAALFKDISSLKAQFPSLLVPGWPEISVSVSPQTISFVQQFFLHNQATFMAAHITWSQMINLKYDLFDYLINRKLIQVNQLPVQLWSNLNVALRDSMILEHFFYP